MEFIWIVGVKKREELILVISLLVYNGYKLLFI